MFAFYNPINILQLSGYISTACMMNLAYKDDTEMLNTYSLCVRMDQLRQTSQAGYVLESLHRHNHQI